MKIILASSSPQRKNLLNLLGIKFSIIPSRAEEITKIKTNCADLVKKNAWLKASDVACRLKEGLVIGSDTVVYVGNKKMILKPKDMKEAKRNLKILFSRPTWVYSGVAVIDAKTKKSLVEYDKTKVFMTPLNDKEIDGYYKKMSPLGKAGGFDIEGLGSVFIHRIEGCYTNVIGLPMARLYRMLKKFGVTGLSIFLMFVITGCSSEYNLATQKEESYLYDTEKEVNIGSKVASKMVEEYKEVNDVEQNERAEKILNKLVEASDRQDIVYSIKILDDEMINAVSLPGGYIFIFKGLLDKVKTDDQLAGVIAHEVGHITARHGIKQLQNSYAGLALQVAAASVGGSQAAAGTSIALASIFMANSQKAEFEADSLAVKYMKNAGYNPQGIIEFFEIIKKEDEKKPLRNFTYWKTHPYVPQRIGNVSKEIKGYLEFKDYIKIMDTDEYKKP